MTFDEIFETAVGVSSVLMVLSGCWIIRVLIQIEKSKVVALASVLQDDGTGTSDLEFTEEGPSKLEVEQADGSPAEIELAPQGKSKKQPEAAPSPTAETTSSKPMTARRARRKQRRISWTFINIQIASVLALILLTYLLLVQSNAAIYWRMIGSLIVFGVFLRFQIGEELRRQRVDRLMLLLSLFLFIASMLSTIVYSFRTLQQGEIYEGPARIVGYSLENYNNTEHDPTTRADIAVSWGKEWGCPLSGGKLCQANIQGAMCQTHPENTKHKPNYGTRLLEDENEKDEKTEQMQEEEQALEEDLEDEEIDNENLEYENEELSAENEKLEEEIAELKEENEVEDEENEMLVEQENSAINEVTAEYDEDILMVEEEMEEDEQAYEDAEIVQDEEKLEDEIEAATDDEKKEDLEEDLEEEEIEKDDIDEEYEEDEQDLEEYEDEFAEMADEDYSEFVEEQNETAELDEEKEELKEEAEETEEEINDGDYSSSNGADDVYDYYEEEAAWYWDEYPSSYDDEIYDDGYWMYDWDSVWGDYACEDLFDADIGGQSYDPTTPAGGDDEWPFVNIYGSCKTCEAYILDYFAEEAFEELQEYKQQAIVYLAGAVAGFIWALLSYIQYKVSPTSENELQLLSSDGGVMA